MCVLWYNTTNIIRSVGVNMFLGRLCGELDASRLEDVITRASDDILHYDGQICSDVAENSETILSDVAVVLDKKYANFPSANKCAEDTRKRNLYFMQATTLEEMGDALRTLAYQPVSEEAIYRIEDGTDTSEDYMGGDRVTALIVEMPDEKFEECVATGKIGVGNGTYEIDGETLMLPEAVVGESAIKEILSGNIGKVLRYDNIHRVLQELDAPIDTHKIPKGEPAYITINNMANQAQKRNTIEKQKSHQSTPKEKGLNSEQLQAIEWIKKQWDKGFLSNDELIVMAKNVGIKNIEKYISDKEDTPTA